MQHILKANQCHLLGEKHILPDGTADFMNPVYTADHRVGRMAKHGGDGVIIFQ